MPLAKIADSRDPSGAYPGHLPADLNDKADLAKVETTLRDDQTITMLVNNPGVTSTATGSNENGGLK